MDFFVDLPGLLGVGGLSEMCDGWITDLGMEKVPLTLSTGKYPLLFPLWPLHQGSLQYFFFFLIH